MEEIRIGQAMKPMLVAEAGASDKKYADIIKKHGGMTVAEIKSDGYRIQVHRNRDDMKFFTRSLRELNPVAFPEIQRQVQDMPNGIYDGELVGIEDGIRGFKAVQVRARDRPDQELIEQYPLKINFFDVMFLEDRPVVDLPLYTRRNFLEQCTGNVPVQQAFEDDYELRQRFEEVTDPDGMGLEGLVCKNPDSLYQIGKKSKDWMKLKRFTNLDLVILGLYKGEGKLAELPFAGVLLGCANNGRYETITKMGLTGRDNVNLIYDQVKDHLVAEPTDNTIISDAINKKQYARKIPFTYIVPERSVVAEVNALNVTRSKNWHSCGLEDGFAYSLRIPSLSRIRSDKTPGECNTTAQIADIYKG